MKIFSKILAVILTISVIFGSISMLAYAADEPLHYVVLGDSIGWGAGVVNRDKACYGKIVADTNGYEYANHAVSGFRSQDLLALLDRDDVKNDVKDADIISISIGGNDLLGSNIIAMIFKALFFNDFSTVDSICENFYKNLCTIISTIREMNPDVTILMQNLYNPRYDLLEKIYKQALNRLNTQYSRYLEEHPGNYVLVDVCTALEGKSDCIAFDTIHPNAKGNVEIARAVLATLRQLGLGEASEPVITEAGVDAFGFGLNFIINWFNYLKRIISGAVK